MQQSLRCNNIVRKIKFNNVSRCHLYKAPINQKEELFSIFHPFKRHPKLRYLNNEEEKCSQVSYSLKQSTHSRELKSRIPVLKMIIIINNKKIIQLLFLLISELEVFNNQTSSIIIFIKTALKILTN